MSNEAEKYHQLAKDAGNRLRAYILSVSSGAVGVFFYTLTGNGVASFSQLDKILILIGLSGFVLTVAISLIELRVDAQRFFFLAKEVGKEHDKQDWAKKARYRKLRYRLLHLTYFTFAIGVLFTSMYLLMRIGLA